MHCQKNQYPLHCPTSLRWQQRTFFGRLQSRQCSYFPRFSTGWMAKCNALLWRSWNVMSLRLWQCADATVRNMHGDGWKGNTRGSVRCSSPESHWTLSLCQLHALWQHNKEEPGSLACELNIVSLLPTRTRTWHALLNKEFLRLWLQAAPLK